MSEDYSNLDRPPSAAVSPTDVAKSMARHRKASRLLKEADHLKEAARIVGQYNCPSIENALTTMAKNLASQSRSLWYKQPEEVNISPEMQGKL